MKTIKNILLSSLTLSLSLTLTSCMDDLDDPVTDNFIITSSVSVGEVNTTIKAVKDKYCAKSSGATFSRNSSNWEFLITEDLVFEGVICSNDGPFGALYQSLYVRSIDGDNDDCIQIGIKNTCLYPYFAIGQRIKVNLKGLYVGIYSKTPKIGFPYYTSKDNHNLGPIPFEMCATNIELVGKPDTSLPECQPIDLTDEEGYKWLRTSAYQTYTNAPCFATVEGEFVEGDDVSILAPDDLKDDGFGVDRKFDLKPGTSGSTKITVRTSTQNEISQIVMPAGKRVRLTGVLSYYDGWQIQIRHTDDFVVLD